MDPVAWGPGEGAVGVCRGMDCWSWTRGRPGQARRHGPTRSHVQLLSLAMGWRNRPKRGRRRAPRRHRFGGRRPSLSPVPSVGKHASPRPVGGHAGCQGSRLSRKGPAQLIGGASHAPRRPVSRNRDASSSRASVADIVTMPPSLHRLYTSSAKPLLIRSDSYTDSFPEPEPACSSPPFNPPPCLTLSVRARARATCSSATLSRRA